MNKRNDLDRFLYASDYKECDGECVALNVFVADFWDWLRGRQIDPAAWPKERVRAEISRSFLVGRGSQNKLHIGNITKTRERPKRYVLANANRLRLEQPCSS